MSTGTNGDDKAQVQGTASGGRRSRRRLRHGRFLSKAKAREAAFHLTDWLADLAELDERLNSPTWDVEGLQKALLSFTAHAPAHLAAAHRIVMGSPVTDVF